MSSEMKSCYPDWTKYAIESTDIHVSRLVHKLANVTTEGRKVVDNYRKEILSDCNVSIATSGDILCER